MCACNHTSEPSCESFAFSELTARSLMSSSVASSRAFIFTRAVAAQVDPFESNFRNQDITFQVQG
jgi:hypothetical protein